MAKLYSFFEIKPSRFLAVLLILHLCSHLPYMKLPAVGNHVWRQCNTLAVARNYYEEDMDLLAPRIDKRYNTPGVTGPQFPAYDWTLAGLYKTTGFSESTHRWLSWVFMAFAIAGMYFLTLGYTRQKFAAGIAASFIAFVPELYFHSINALPDILSLAAMLWGWHLGRKWLATNNWVYCLFAAILLALAGMVKMQFLVAGVAIGIEFILIKNKKPVLWVQAIILAAVAIIPTLWWYWYAAKLVQLYGLHEFVHAMRHARNLTEGLQILAKNAFSDFPEVMTGYGFLLFVLLGFWAGRNTIKKYPYLWGYAFACVLFYVLVQYQFLHHGYYAIIFFPALALLVARGAIFVRDSRYSAVIFLLILTPVWAWARMASSNWTERNYKIPLAFTKAEDRAQFVKLSDTSVRWIVGPDVSGCVYFYYLHAKGYPWTDTAETADMFVKYVRMGAKGVITNDTITLHKRVGNKLKLRQTGAHAGFYWFRIE